MHDSLTAQLKNWIHTCVNEAHIVINIVQLSSPVFFSNGDRAEPNEEREQGPRFSLVLSSGSRRGARVHEKYGKNEGFSIWEYMHGGGDFCRTGGFLDFELPYL